MERIGSLKLHKRVTLLHESPHPPILRADTLASRKSTNTSTHRQTITPNAPATPAVDDQSGVHSDAASSSDTFTPSWRLKLAIISMSALALMSALDSTSLSPALPVMAQDLHGSAIETFWSATSFTLTQTVFQPVIGILGDVFGLKSLMFVSLAFFGAGALVAALAENFSVIIIGRSLQGVGGGGVTLLTEIVIASLVPLKHRGNYYSIISSMWALGTVLGPLIGGAFADGVSWRWVFYINFPFIGISVPLLTMFLQLNHRMDGFREKLARIDYVGIVLFVGSGTSFIIPLTWGGVEYRWRSWHTLVPLFVGAAGLAAFVFYEKWLKKRGEEPMLHFSPAKGWSAISIYHGTLTHGVLIFCVLYYIPLYYEGVKGLSATLTGVALFPESFTVAPAAIAGGFYISKTGKFRPMLWVGWGFCTLGLGLLCLLEPGTSTVGWIFLNLPFGLGAGLLFTSMAIGTQACCPEGDAAHAVVLYTLLRSAGSSLGLALGGSIFQNEMRRKLSQIPSLASQADAYAKDSSALTQVLRTLPNSDPTKLLLAQAYTDSLRTVFGVMCALSGFAFVTNLFLVKEYSIDRELVTEHGFKDKHKLADAEASSLSEREDPLHKSQDHDPTQEKVEEDEKDFDHKESLNSSTNSKRHNYEPLVEHPEDAGMDVP